MDAERYRDDMFRLVQSVLTEIGPRESCSENERRLGRRLVELWTRAGMAVHTEGFICHPQAFLGFIPFAVLLYLSATVFYWMLPAACGLLAAASFALIWFELLRYRELVDPLFPRATGENVVGIIRPNGTVLRRVVVSAHQDSAYEFNLWYLLKTAAVPLMVIAFAAPLVPLVGGLAKSLAGSATDAHAFDVIGYVCLGLCPVVGLNLFFHTYSVVPGAMDNLAGISVLTGVGRALTDATHSAAAALENTEVVLLATSSEEAGLRGAKRYASQHGSEFTQVPTYGIFVDGVYDERFLTVINRELFTGVRHDARLVRLAKDVSAKRGFTIRQHMIPLGASDASAFAQVGVPTVCLLCQDIARLVPNYHTRLDTIDYVRPESLRVMLQVVLDMIEHVDTEGLVPR